MASAIVRQVSRQPYSGISDRNRAGALVTIRISGEEKEHGRKQHEFSSIWRVIYHDA